MTPLSRRVLLASGLAAITAPADAMPLGRRPGIELYTVNDAMQFNTAGTLKALQDIGYREVESVNFGKGSARDFRKLLDDAGLACVSCQMNFRDGDNGALFADAHTVGASYVVSPSLSGAVGGGMDAAAFHRMAALANRIGAAAKRAGLQYAYHNHNPEFRDVGGTTGYDLLLRETDPALVKFEIDCGWMRLAGHDPAQYLKAHPGRVALLHIKDFVKPAGPSTEMRGHPGSVLGKGFIDYRPIFAAAGQIRHYFVEQEPPFNRLSSLDAARIDYAYLRAL